MIPIKRTRTYNESERKGSPFFSTTQPISSEAEVSKQLVSPSMSPIDSIDLDSKIDAAYNKFNSALEDDKIPTESRDAVKEYVVKVGTEFITDLTDIILECYDLTKKAEEKNKKPEATDDIIESVNKLLAGTGIQINTADDLNKFIQNAAQNCIDAYNQSLLFSNPDIMNTYNALMAAKQQGTAV